MVTTGIPRVRRMRIGILGAGNMADALGGQWAAAGHEMMIGARTPAKALALAGRLGPRARAGGLRDAAEYGDAVLLAVRYEGLPDVFRTVGGALRGRTLVDCVNGIVHPGVTLARPSVAEWIAGETGASVVKAFNLCHDSVWRRRPHFEGRPLAVPICGDDPDALMTVRTLVTAIGGEPLDAGGLTRAALLEATAAFAIGLLIGGADPRAVFPPVAYARG
jgi:8-hydroxy-5-deazaflavin:NADPH oxidoreductase